MCQLSQDECAKVTNDDSKYEGKTLVRLKRFSKPIQVYLHQVDIESLKSSSDDLGEYILLGGGSWEQMSTPWSRRALSAEMDFMQFAQCSSYGWNFWLIPRRPEWRAGETSLLAWAPSLSKPWRGAGTRSNGTILSSSGRANMNFTLYNSNGY